MLDSFPTSDGLLSVGPGVRTPVAWLLRPGKSGRRCRGQRRCNEVYRTEPLGEQVPTGSMQVAPCCRSAV